MEKVFTNNDVVRMILAQLPMINVLKLARVSKTFKRASNLLYENWLIRNKLDISNKLLKGDTTICRVCSKLDKQDSCEICNVKQCDSHLQKITTKFRSYSNELSKVCMSCRKCQCRTEKYIYDTKKLTCAFCSPICVNCKKPIKHLILGWHMIGRAHV